MENRPRLSAFGSVELTVGRDVVTLPAKAEALIVLLAHDCGSKHPRAEVAALLWPNATTENARHSLSQALYDIKRKTGCDIITATPQTIAIPSIAADFLDFREAIEQENWKRASTFYKGPFAKNLRVPDAVGFQHWLDGSRAEYANLAEKAARQLASEEHWEEAIDVAESILAEDPENPNMARVKALALLANAGREAVLDFADSLKGESATQAVQAVSNSPAIGEGHDRFSQKERFVGRTEAMAWLQRHGEKGLSGSPTLALIQGEPGSGKTSLVNRFARLMAIRGARILPARAYHAEQNIPFGVATQWVGKLAPSELQSLSEYPWMQVVGHFFPQVGTALDIQDTSRVGQIGHQRLLESLRRLITSVASDRPLVLVVDDIHLADSASLAFLHYLLRHSAGRPLFAVATTRLERGKEVSEVRGWDHVSQWTLEGLTRSEVADYLQLVSREASEPFDADVVDHVFRQTGGNPLLLSILVRDERHEGRTIASPPASIIEFFRPRLLQQSIVERRLLAALAILAEPCTSATLSEMAGTSMAETKESLARLEDAHLIIREHDQVRLRHGLVGEVALSLQGDSEKQRLHGRTARFLTRSGTRSSQMIATSHDLAGNRREAFEASLNASLACDVLHARKEKEFFLTLALSNAPSEVEESQVRVQLAELYLKQRQLARALDLLDVEKVPEAASELRRRTEVLRLRVLAEMTGDVEALGQIWTKAREAANELPPLFVADTYTHIGGVAWDLGMDELAGEVAELVIDRLATLPVSETTAQRMLRPTVAIGVIRGYGKALERIAALPEPSGHDPVYVSTFHYAKATLLVAAGRLLEAETHFAQSLGLTERFALFDHVHAINNNLGVCLMEQGKYDEAAVHFEEARKHAAPTSPSQHSTSHDNFTILAYERGEYAAALQSAADLLGSRKVSGGRAVMSLYAIMGLSGLEVGDLSRCSEAERDLRVLMSRYGGHSNDMSYAHVFLARMEAVRRNEGSALEALSSASAHFRARNKLAYVRLQLERCRLLLKTGSDCSALLDDILSDLRGSGAVPLIERAEGLKARAELHRA